MRFLGNVLRMKNSRFARKFLLPEPEIGWKRSCGGQVMTSHCRMQEATRTLAAVGPCHLLNWGPNDLAHKWLSILKDMVRDRCRWHSCYNVLTIFDLLTSSNFFPNFKMASFFFNLFFLFFFHIWPTEK